MRSGISTRLDGFEGVSFGEANALSRFEVSKYTNLALGEWFYCVCFILEKHLFTFWNERYLPNISGGNINDSKDHTEDTKTGAIEEAPSKIAKADSTN